MIAEQLKKSILQAAIQGKLTQQLPEDGDARDLLKEIRKEKARLIQEGKIKKEKPLPEITEDEVPFEIPDNWCWVRLQGITSEIGDGIHGTPIYDDNGGYYFINGSNLVNGKIEIKDSTKKVNIREYEKFKKSLGEATVLVSINGTLGNVSFYNNEKVILGKSACYFNLIGHVLKNYIKILLASGYFLDYSIENATGSTIKNVSLKAIRMFQIPLPPVLEQKRIVERIEELLPEIESLKNDETKLEELQKSFPKKMKDAILQYAIQGKLTQQLPEDGDARDLLKEIQKEKAKLIKEGKIKKEKPLPEITKDEIPFEIPENWCWVRLGEISDISAGTTPDRKYIIAKGNIPYYKVSDMNTQGNDKYMGIAQEYLSEQYPGKLLEPYTIIYPKNGGAVFTNKRRITTDKCLVDLNTGYCKPYNSNCLDYLFYWFLMLDLVNYYSGTALPTVSAGVIKNLLIPIPPLSGQNRIVSCLEKLLPLCEELL